MESSSSLDYDTTFESGFTLIELLVVISIIGFIASVVVVNLGATRMRARNSQRDQNYKKIAMALEGYREDHGTFPPASSWTCLGPVGLKCFAGNVSGDDTIYNSLLPYIQNLPTDNIGKGFGLNYPMYADSNQGGYRMMILYTFYEGDPPDACNDLFAGTYYVSDPLVWETGGYVCLTEIKY